MECPNCGAQLEENQRLCPYCGYENTEVAMREQESFIQSIYRKTAELFNIPERIVRKTVKKIIKVVIVLFIFFIVMMIGKTVWIKIENENALKHQNENLDKLEEYYQNKEYDKMNDYLLTIEDAYESVYEKYDMVSSLYRSFNETQNFLKQDIKLGGKNSPEIFGGYISQYVEILNKIAILEDGGFAYGEKEALLFYREEVMKELKNVMKLSDEEIEEACGYELYSEEMNELGKIVIERLEGENEV